ncbi:MAG: cellulase family glycosylhydrolase [Chloroflexi bacterium]|nr:cellulase family glycosylhydrolase [Chloroflexota bacterium]
MIHTQGPWFVDEHGRVVVLRGVNLSGSSKVPIGLPTRVREGFFDHRHVSFVGRPFPIEEADEHFARMREWGLTFVRFLVTWEAIEHAGPGQYDAAYLDYLVQVIEKARQHHIRLFIDPHQDVWGRLSGGDGAPGWTYEAIGFNPQNFTETGAAIVHCTFGGETLPRMIWPSNYSKLAAATMFTLFFGGNAFAPQLKIDGESAQDYLQRHYLDALRQVAQRVTDLPNVVGFDSFNEPSTGYIGVKDLALPMNILRTDAAPTPFESMLLGAGLPRQIDVYEMTLLGPRKRGQRLINPQGVSAWCDDRECIWKQHGVWDVDANGTPRLLKPDYFSHLNGRPVDPTDDFIRPFIRRYAREIRSAMPHAVIFAENVTLENSLRWTVDDAPNVANAAHWYDVLTLYFKDHISFFSIDPITRRLALGAQRVRRLFAEQLRDIRHWGIHGMNQAPTVIGEFGVPFDLKKKHAYRTGDFGPQTRALDSYLDAMDANLLNWTLWNYTPDNDNRWGDQWNDEDLSIFSRDQQTNPQDINSGGRALEAVVRPYARAIAGEPLHMKFDRKSRHFELEFRHHAEVTAPTEIFVPNYQYPHGYRVEVSDGTYDADRAEQLLIYRHSTKQAVHRVRVSPL